MSNLRQSKIIGNVNAYLAEHRFPIKLNENGICHGLSILHAKYILDGQEEEFRKLLQILSGEAVIPKEQQNEIDVQIHRFVTAIFAAHNPRADHRFQVNFTNSYEQFYIGEQKDKPIKSLYKLGMVTTPENWASIFQKIDLKEDEVVMVGSTRHAISIIRQGTTYKIYDPNNKELYKEFAEDDLKAMMEYLQKTTFRYKGEGSLGLDVNILSLKDVRETPFPLKSELYNTYFFKNADVVHENDGSPQSSLIFAAIVSDVESINLILREQPDATIIKKAANIIIQQGTPDALEPLLQALLNQGDDDITSLIKNGIAHGSLEMLETLLKEPKLLEEYQSCIECFPISTLHHCLRGGDPRVIEKVVSDLFKNPEKNLPLINNTIGTNKDVFMETINSQNPKALEILCQTLKKYDSNLIYQLKNNPHYLAQAIKNNNPDMVTTLLNEFDYRSNKDCINQISLNLSVIRETDVNLLKNLQAHGMEFSLTAKNLILEKDATKIGILEQFGIALMSFSEFLKKHVLRQTDGIKITTDAVEHYVEKKSPQHVIEFEDSDSDDDEVETMESIDEGEKKQEHSSQSQTTEAFKVLKNKFHSILNFSREIEQKTEENKETLNSAFKLTL